MTSYAGDEFVGFTVSRGEKQALKALAKQRGISISNLLRKLLAGELQTWGVTPPSPGPPSELLPFEEKTLVVTSEK